MKIRVKVFPSSSRQLVKEENGLYKIYLHASPDKGKANQELIEVLSDHFQASKSKIAILQGTLSRTKVVEITS